MTRGRKTRDISGTANITVEREGHILLIGLNRIDKRNAINPEMEAGLSRAYNELDTNLDLRVGVLFAHGEHFCAGVDLPASAPSMAQEKRTETNIQDNVDPLGLRSRKCRKPVVVAVHGRCFTIGIEYILASEICIAADNTIFAQLEVSRGIFPLGGTNWRFPQQVGWGNAMRYILTADNFDAHEALRIGLVQEIVPLDKQLERALEIAHRIAAQSPLGVYAALRNARTGYSEGEAAAYAEVGTECVRIFATEDAKEGMRAMVERRQAKFTGH